MAHSCARAFDTSCIFANLCYAFAPLHTGSSFGGSPPPWRPGVTSCEGDEDERDLVGWCVSWVFCVCATETGGRRERLCLAAPAVGVELFAVERVCQRRNKGASRSSLLLCDGWIDGVRMEVWSSRGQGSSVSGCGRALADAPELEEGWRHTGEARTPTSRVRRGVRQSSPRILLRATKAQPTTASARQHQSTATRFVPPINNRTDTHTDKKATNR